MNDASLALQPYLSHATITLLRRGRRVAHGEGAVLFVDVAGFTALTRASAGQGAAGAELVSDRLNRFFGALIPVIAAHGGDVLDFGGDAIHALFPRRRAVLRCAEALRGAAHVDPALSVRIGIGVGRYRIDLIGDAGQQRTLFSGPAVRHAAHAEKRAPQGGVRLHASCARLRPGRLGPVERPSELAPRALPAPEAQLRAFLHPALVERIGSGFVNEHRAVTVLFAAAADRATLAAILAQVQALDGCVTRIDADGDDLRALALFGAPVTHEDDVRRAVFCAQALQQTQGARVRAGIATGTLFCGDAGAATRREYTVMGDAVNLAARLLQRAAPGGVLTDTATRDLLPGLTWRAVTGQVVKGFDHAIDVHEPLAAVNGAVPESTPSAAVALIGRAAETAQLDAVLHAARRGQGAALQIVGPPGMGKTALAAWVMWQGAELGLHVLRAAAQPYGQPAYAVWAQLLRAWLGPVADVAALDAALRAAVPDAVTGAISGSAWLARVLGLRDARQAWIDTLSPATRAAELHATVIVLFHALARSQPALLCIDDAHWLDPDSIALLNALTVQLEPHALAVLTLSRAPVGAQPVLQLGALTPDAASMLAAQALGDAAAPVHAQAQIVARAQGNPFFIEQLARFVRADPQRHGELPRSLRALLLQRIDRLGADEQTALKLASVIGPQLNSAWLRGCWPGTPPQAFDAMLARLIDEGLLRPERGPAWVTHAFAHATLREAAYDALSAALRTALHERVGRWIERQHAPRDFLEMLAYHFGRSADADKQRHYFTLAGDAARATYNNAAAIGHYERLLPLLPADRQPDVQVRLATVRAHIGDWPQAEQHLRAALSAGVSGTRARAELELGKLLARSRSHGDAAPWLTRAAAHFGALRQPAALGEALTHLASAQLERGELHAARATALRLLRLVRRQSLHAGEADAQQMLGQLALQRGQLVRADACLRAAAAQAARLRDPRRALLIDNDRATLAWQRGDYRASFAYFRAALKRAQHIGWRAWTGVLLGNIGVLFWELGAAGRARELGQRALTIARELNDQTSETISLGNVAAVLAGQGERTAARDMFAAAMALSTRLGLPYYLCDQARQAAELAWSMGDVDSAAALCSRAAAAARRAGDNDTLLRLRVLRARIAQQRSQRTPAAAARGLRALLPDASADQRALLHEALWQLVGDPADAEAAIAQYRALHGATPRQAYRSAIAALGGREPAVPAWVRRLTVVPIT